MSKELWVAGTGLIGNKVAEIARSQNIETSVTAKSEAESPDGSLELVDITDFEAVLKYFWDHEFTKVIVAAGIALPAAAEKNPELAYLVNAEGPHNIGRAILSLPEARRPSVVFMGSALQYDVRRDGAVTEETPFVKSGSVYVSSKNKMVEFVRELVNEGLDAKIAMIFNTSGPGQSTDYFLPSLADQVAKIYLGIQEPLIKTRYVGHSRDFSHVDDTAQGILLSLRGKSGDLINISSGVGIELQEIINSMVRVSGMVGVYHVADPLNNSMPLIQSTWGDNSRLRSLGFVPQKELSDLCRDLFEERLRINEKK